MLRAATAPDANQDQGEHSFVFFIMPHTGRLVESGVIKRAMALTNEPLFRSTTRAAPSVPRFELEGRHADGIVLDAIKRGEDDERDGVKSVVLRVYEAYGGRARGVLKM